MSVVKQTDEEELFDICSEMIFFAHYSFASNIEKSISLVKQLYDTIKPSSSDKSKYIEYVETILNKDYVETNGKEMCEDDKNIRADILFLSEQPMTIDMIDDLITILKDIRKCIF